jgi:hypothetical protein
LEPIPYCVLKVGTTREDAISVYRWKPASRFRSVGLATMDALHSLCVQLSARELLIAAPDGRSWLTCLDTSKITALPLSALAAERSSLAASAIEGAIIAGLAQTGDAPTNVSCTLARYVRWLAGNYVFAGQTPGLFRRAAERFEASFRPDLAAFALKKAEEEDGHANLAYRDLEALDLPAAQVIGLVRPPSADAFADRFRMYVESREPIALFGFSYCLERMAVGRDEVFIQKIQTICPPTARAIRFLKVHSNVGSDSAHVHEQMSFFESLTEVELIIVTRAAFETAVMLAQQPLMDQALTDAEIGHRLERAEIGLSTTEQRSNKQGESNNEEQARRFA